MKIGLIIPPSNPKHKPRIPLEALYIASVLKAEHHEVVVFDFTFDKFINRRMFKKGFHCFWIVSNANFQNSLEIKAFLPKGIKTIISGDDPTIRAEDTSKYGWDYILVGEPEIAANGIVMGVFQPGILYCQTPENLDGIPFPSRGSVSIKNYYGRINMFTTMEIVGSRGMLTKTYDCIQRRPRRRSSDNIIEEMANIDEIYGVKNFVISNFVFTQREDLLKDFLLKMTKNKYKFSIISPIDKVARDKGTPELLKAAGCEHVSLMPSISDGSDPRRLTEAGIKTNGWV